jgi:hypothetical protein
MLDTQRRDPQSKQCCPCVTCQQNLGSVFFFWHQSPDEPIRTVQVSVQVSPAKVLSDLSRVISYEHSIQQCNLMQLQSRISPSRQLPSRWPARMGRMWELRCSLGPRQITNARTTNVVLLRVPDGLQKAGKRAECSEPPQGNKAMLQGLLHAKYIGTLSSAVSDGPLNHLHTPRPPPKIAGCGITENKRLSLFSTPATTTGFESHASRPT